MIAAFTERSGKRRGVLTVSELSIRTGREAVQIATSA
jgi:hypothetical protein